MFGGYFSDVFTIRLVRRNKGVFEPEMRLWLMLVNVICLPASLILWGVGAAHHVHWFALVVAFGVLQMANCATIPISVNYLVDSYKDQSGDAMTTVMIIRNTMGFALTYGYVNVGFLFFDSKSANWYRIDPWIQTMGLQNTFITCACISLLTSCSFLIMIVWGKKIRKDSRTRYWALVKTSLENGMAH
jgi:MFS family permease